MRGVGSRLRFDNLRQLRNSEGQGDSSPEGRGRRSPTERWGRTLSNEGALPTKVVCCARDADGFHLAERDQEYLDPDRPSVAHPRPGKGACRVARGDDDGAEDPRSKVTSLKGRSPREQRPAAVGNERRSERIRRRIKASKWVKLAGRHEPVVSPLK